MRKRTTGREEFPIDPGHVGSPWGVEDNVDRCPCGEPLPAPTRKGGRVRKYHNNACRLKYHRRKANVSSVPIGRNVFSAGHERTQNQPTADTPDDVPPEKYYVDEKNYSDGGLDSYDDSVDEEQIIAEMIPRGVSVSKAPMSLGTKGDAADEWLKLHDPEIGA